MTKYHQIEHALKSKFDIISICMLVCHVHSYCSKYAQKLCIRLIQKKRLYCFGINSSLFSKLNININKRTKSCQSFNLLNMENESKVQQNDVVTALEMEVKVQESNKNTSLRLTFLWKKLSSFLLINVYDTVTILISIADLITDLLVLGEFHKEKKQTFFVIALIILIVAQQSYAFAFYARFAVDGKNTSLGKRRIFFSLCVLFSPLLSFVMYYVSVKDNIETNCILKLLNKHGFKDAMTRNWYRSNNNDEDDDENELEGSKVEMLIWVETKLRKHLGFILEAALEALPQSIIQLIAIIYYQDRSYLSALSIMISLISVATKSMVFTLAWDIKIFLLNWLGLIFDFFSVFVVLSWYVDTA